MVKTKADLPVAKCTPPRLHRLRRLGYEGRWLHPQILGLARQAPRQQLSHRRIEHEARSFLDDRLPQERELQT